MSDHRNRSRCGSVLLETVLAIPLYLILLGGTMWIGELMLAKVKLVVADRYATWNGGNRHRLDKGGIMGEIQDNFFNPAQVGDEEVVNIRYEHGIVPPPLWDAPFGATVDLLVTAPAWTEGWLASGVMYEGVTKVPNSVVFSGRDDEVVSAPSHHAVIMRTLFGDYAYRIWSPRQIADPDLMPWNEHIRLEPWTQTGFLHPTDAGQMQEVSGLPSPPSGDDYTRFSQYEDWSD